MFKNEARRVVAVAWLSQREACEQGGDILFKAATYKAPRTGLFLDISQTLVIYLPSATSLGDLFCRIMKGYAVPSI